MARKKEMVTAAGTLAIAIGIGFVMQSGDTAKARYGTTEQSSAAAEELDAVAVPEENAALVLAVQGIELTQAVQPAGAAMSMPAAEIQRVSAPADIAEPSPIEDFLPDVDPCDVSATAEIRPGAMVHLSLTAGCFPNERVTVHHNGMMFTEVTDKNGALDLIAPALTRQAVYIMAFSNGDGAVTEVEVPDLADYDRVVLQWRGDASFQLHAREFGAGYGDEGHVWTGADQNIDGMTAGSNGHLMRLGDTKAPLPLIAEVYTYPSGLTARDGLIDMTVEAEVTRDNCGIEAEAQSLELTEGGIKTRYLTLSMPSCDAVGNFLVLNNLISDLKVASN